MLKAERAQLEAVQVLFFLLLAFLVLLAAVWVELVAANAELAATNERVDEERRRVRTILARLDAGVVAFGDDDTLYFLNETARRLLGRDENARFPRAQDLLASEALAPLNEFLARGGSGRFRRGR